TTEPSSFCAAFDILHLLRLLNSGLASQVRDAERYNQDACPRRAIHSKIAARALSHPAEQAPFAWPFGAPPCAPWKRHTVQPRTAGSRGFKLLASCSLPGRPRSRSPGSIAIIGLGWR